MSDVTDTHAEPQSSAEVISIADPSGPRRIDMGLLDLSTLKGEINGMIDALGEIRWALPTLLFGAGSVEISLDSRARLAEMVRGAGESVRLTLEAARTLFELVPDAAATSAEETPPDDAPAALSLAPWRNAMSAPIDRVADVADKVMLLQAMPSESPEWANGLAQILLDIELLGRSAVASLPLYNDPQEAADLFALHQEWCGLRAQYADLTTEEAIDEWALAMSGLVHRLLMAPAWTAAGRRLKFEVFRHEMALAGASERFTLDERAPMWLSALEVDATRKVA